MPNFLSLPHTRCMQKTFSNLMKMAEVLQKGRKHSGKMRNCLLQEISPFPQSFQKTCTADTYQKRAQHAGANARL